MLQSPTQSIPIFTLTVCDKKQLFYTVRHGTLSIISRGLTDMSVLLIYYFMPYWAYYLVFLIMIPLSFLIVYFNMFFVESAHFLVHVKKDLEAANEVL